MKFQRLCFGINLLLFGYYFMNWPCKHVMREIGQMTSEKAYFSSFNLQM